MAQLLELNTNSKITNKSDLLADDIRNRIKNKQYKNEIPSERTLAKQYNVNAKTVNKATSILIEEGLLYRIKGKGTLIAKSGFRKKVKEIAAIFPEISTSFHSQILKGIENVVKNNDYRLSIATSGGNSKEELEIIKNFSAKGINNFIIEPSASNTNIDYFRKIRKNGSALVFVDSFLRDVDADYVVTDNIWGAYKGVTHLITLGYKRIGYLGGIHGQAAIEDRFHGYKKALKKNGIPIDERLIKKTDCSEKSNYQAMRELLMMKDRLQAVFIVSKLYILGALKAIREEGLTVPDDLFLLGFDFLELNLSQLRDINFTSFVRMPLPTIDQNPYKMGEKAAVILIKQREKSLHEDNLKPQQVLLKPKLRFDLE